MQITVAALNPAPELRGLAHNLREVADRLDLVADVLQFPEPGDITVDQVYRDLMETVNQTSSAITGIAHAAETVAYANSALAQASPARAAAHISHPGSDSGSIWRSVRLSGVSRLLTVGQRLGWAGSVGVISSEVSRPLASGVG